MLNSAFGNDGIDRDLASVLGPYSNRSTMPSKNVISRMALARWNAWSALEVAWAIFVTLSLATIFWFSYSTQERDEVLEKNIILPKAQLKRTSQLVGAKISASRSSLKPEGRLDAISTAGSSAVSGSNHAPEEIERPHQPSAKLKPMTKSILSTPPREIPKRGVIVEAGPSSVISKVNLERPVDIELLVAVTEPAPSSIPIGTRSRLSVGRAPGENKQTVPPTRARQDGVAAIRALRRQ